MRAALLALPILVCAGAVHAQELRPFCADRPGKATPPCILDAGHAQLEVGLGDADFRHTGGADEDTYALAASELRLGLSKRLEAELAWTPLIVDRQKNGPHVTGAGDLTLGARWALSDPDAQAGVAVSAQGFVTAPTATHGLGAGGWAGGFRAPIASPLAGGFSLGVTPEADVTRNAAGGGTHLTLSTALSLSHGFGDATFGAELWGLYDDDPRGRSRQATFDLTAAYAIGKSGQLDAGLNFGLNRETPGVEVYAGVSHRF